MRTKKLLAIALMIAMLLFSLQTAVGEDVIADMVSDVAAADVMLEAASEEETDTDEDLELGDEVIAEEETPGELPQEEALEVAPEEDIVAAAEEEELPADAAEDIEEIGETDLFAVLEDGEELAESLESEPEEPEVAEYSAVELGTLNSVEIYSETGSFDVTEGQTLQLGTTTNEGSRVQSFVWTSSDETVASVNDNGTVTAYDVEAPTKVFITVTAYEDTRNDEGIIIEKTPVEDEGKTDTIEITVHPVTSKVVLKQDDGTEIADALTVDRIAVLNYTCEPSAHVLQGLEAKTSDPSVLFAEVDEDDGSVTLTAMDNGTVTLTLTSEDGMAQKVVTVEVKKDSGANTTLRLDAPTKLQIVKGKTASIAPQVLPKGAYKKVTYTYVTKNKALATVTKTGVVKGVKVGKAAAAKGVWVTATVTKLDGATQKFTKQIAITVVAKATTKVSALKADKTKLVVGGSAANLTATLQPAVSNSNKQIIWSTSSAKIATVQGNGLKAVVTPIAPGTVTITAKTNDGTNKKKTIKLTVYEKPAKNELAIDGPTVIVAQKAVTYKTVATNSKALSEGATWSLDQSMIPDGMIPATATIDEKTGALTTQSEGFVHIIARDINNPSAKAELNVEVKGKPVETINITGVTDGKATIDLLTSAELQLNAAAEPADADQSVTWATSNAKIATVDETGKVTAKAASLTPVKITATAKDGSGVTASVEITVTKKVSDFTIDNVEVAVGKTITLKPVLQPEGAVGKITFSGQTAATKKIAVLNTKTGAVKGVLAGKTITLKVKVDDLDPKPVKVKVVAKTATKVTVKSPVKGNYILPVEDASAAATDTNTLQLTAAITPTTASKKVTWTSSNTGIVTVDQTGKVTAVPGVVGKTATVTATACDGSGKKASVTVRVGYAPEAITLKVANSPVENTLYVAKGKTTPVGAVIAEFTGKDGKTPSWQTVTWSIVDAKGKANKAYATVNANGQVKGVKAGTVYLMATAKDGSGVKSAYKKLKVVVVKSAVSKLSINGDSFMYEGQESKLTATVTNSLAKNNVGVVWTTSNAKVVSIQPDGTAKAEGLGKATITATATDSSAQKKTLTIEVGKPAASVKVFGLNAVAVGAKNQLRAVVFAAPAEGETEGAEIPNSPVKWTSNDETIAKVNAATGEVEGVAAGHAIITATALAVEPANQGTVVAEVAMEVTGTVTELSVWRTVDDELVNVGGNEANPIVLNTNKKNSAVQLIARVEPDSANPSVKWTPSDSKKLAVDANGVVTPIADGTAYVTASILDGGAAADVKVYFNVSEAKPTLTVTAPEGQKYLAAGRDLPLTAAASIDGEPITSPLTWSSSSETTTVEDGIVTANAADVGKAVTITVTNDEYGLEATYEITVTQDLGSNDALALKANPDDPRIDGDGNLNLTTNDDAIYQIQLAGVEDGALSQLIFESNDPTVVTVDENGLITVVGNGTATIITVKTQDGTGYENSFGVTVKTKADSVAINATEGWTLHGNKALVLTVTATASNGKEVTSEIKLVSSDPDVATIDENGNVTIKKAGTVKFTVKVDGETFEGVEYEPELVSDFAWSADGTAITGFAEGYAKNETEITIPEYVNGTKVTAIDEGAFEGKTILTKVNIPNRIQTIGARAFKGCTSLAEMVPYGDAE